MTDKYKFNTHRTFEFEIDQIKGVPQVINSFCNFSESEDNSNFVSSRMLNFGFCKGTKHIPNCSKADMLLSRLIRRKIKIYECTWCD